MTAVSRSGGLTVILLIFAAGAAADELAQWFAAATEALQRGEYETARKGFQAVLSKNPRHLPALGNLGVVYSQTRQWDLAVATYRKALQLAPGNVLLELNLGLAYFKQEQYAAAEPHFAAVLKQQPAHGQAAELLGASRIYAGRAQPAVAVLEPLADREPTNAGVLYLLGLARARAGDGDGARQAWQQMFEHAASKAQAFYLMGRAQYENGLFEEAVRDLEQAARLDPALDGIDRELGKAYVSQRRNGDAEARLRAALRKDASDVEAAYFLGGLLAAGDDVAEAGRLLEGVARARPNFWGAWYYLGRVHLKQRRIGEAVQDLERAARQNPAEAAIHYQLARAYQAAGRPEDAARSRRRLTAIRSETATGDEAEILRHSRQTPAPPPR